MFGLLRVFFFMARLYFAIGEAVFMLNFLGVLMASSAVFCCFLVNIWCWITGIQILCFIWKESFMVFLNFGLFFKCNSTGCDCVV